MDTKTKKITGGVYLVLDSHIKREILVEKLEQALEGGVDAVQIWNHRPGSFSRKEKEELVNDILSVTIGYHVPLLINEEWELLKTTELDGVHFDVVPDNFSRIQSETGREFICGITCSNDLDVIRWADENDFDYISFCSMFPSPSVDSCEIVRPETVRKAREITGLPLFVSGGITTGNLSDLEELEFEGVAVISGILNSDSPRERTQEYKKALNEKSPFPKGGQRGISKT